MSTDLLPPRVTLAEMVARFAAQGIMVREVDGALHVAPPDRLTRADRDLLTAHRLGFLDVVSGRSPN